MDNIRRETYAFPVRPPNKKKKKAEKRKKKIARHREATLVPILVFTTVPLSTHQILQLRRRPRPYAGSSVPRDTHEEDNVVVAESSCEAELCL